MNSSLIRCTLKDQLDHYGFIHKLTTRSNSLMFFQNLQIYVNHFINSGCNAITANTRQLMDIYELLIECWIHRLFLFETKKFESLTNFQCHKNYGMQLPPTPQHTYTFCGKSSPTYTHNQDHVLGLRRCIPSYQTMASLNLPF